jgi:carbon-monoxide dehydrogenase medium subunit
MTAIAEHEEIRCHASCLAQAAASVGSWQIRNRATLGGNLANASPAADTPVALAVLDAVAILISPRGVRKLLTRDIPTGPNTTVLELDELIASFRVPLKPSRISAFSKVGSRSQVTIARLNLAVSALFDGDGKFGNPRVFAGTLGIAARRCSAAEKILSQTETRHLTTPDVSGSFCAALATAVEEAIPGRDSLPYKRSAIQALGLDVLTALMKAANARNADVKKE